MQRKSRGLGDGRHTPCLGNSHCFRPIPCKWPSCERICISVFVCRDQPGGACMVLCLKHSWCLDALDYPLLTPFPSFMASYLTLYFFLWMKWLHHFEMMQSCTLMLLFVGFLYLRYHRTIIIIMRIYKKKVHVTLIKPFVDNWLLSSYCTILYLLVWLFWPANGGSTQLLYVSLGVILCTRETL